MSINKRFLNEGSPAGAVAQILQDLPQIHVKEQVTDDLLKLLKVYELVEIWLTCNPTLFVEVKKRLSCTFT